MSLKDRLQLPLDPIFLVDGTAFLYRAYYAYPDLKRSDGFPTNAIFIVMRLLLRILKEEKPGHIGFFLDGRKPTYRHELLPTYKAQRPSMPEPLALQIEPLLSLVKSLGIFVYTADGVEGDDCLASLAAKFKNQQPVVIVGSDKDLLQCLDKAVILWDPVGKSERITTLDSFQKDQGLNPSQWPDFQALTGDSSDNIPGVPGIGPKSALSLLARFPSLEALRDHMAELAPKEQAKLSPHLDLIFLYRELTRLKTDCCSELSLKDLARKTLDETASINLLKEFEFHSLVRDLSSVHGRESTQKKTVPTAKMRLLPLGQAEISPAAPSPLPSLPDHLGFSEQTLGLVPQENGPVRGFILGLKDKEYFFSGNVATLATRLSQAKRIAVPSLKRLLADHDSFWKINLGSWFDLSLAAYLLDPEERDYDWNWLKQRHESLVVVSPSQDGLFADALAEQLSRRLSTGGLADLLITMELPLIPVLVKMERRGVAIDQKAFSVFLSEVEKELHRLSKAIELEAGETFNLRSSQQLSHILFEKLNLKSKRKTPGGVASTSSEVLEALADLHPIVPLILDFRMLEKLRSTYLAPLPSLVDQNGRLHTTFNNLATATGRLSSSSPNLQNIPIRGKFGPRMRACFVAKPDYHLVSADYSQIELRILAALSKDPTLTEAFHQGEDIHTRTASVLFEKAPADVALEERRKAKTINFGLLYGMGPQKLGRELSIPMAEAKKFIEIYFSRLSGVKTFFETVEEEAKRLGYVTTIFGRRRLLPDIHSRNPNLAQAAKRMAINTVIQGSAADIIKLAMLAVDHDEHLAELQAELLLQVHDELVMEVPKKHSEAAGRRLSELMTSVHDFGLPLGVDWRFGHTWSEAHA